MKDWFDSAVVADIVVEIWGLEEREKELSFGVPQRVLQRVLI